jgi:hypothetical protein
MTEPENQEQSTPEQQPPPDAASGAAAGGERDPKPSRGLSLAIASTVGIVLAATAFQNLWNQAGPLIDESRRTTGIFPLIVLSGVAGLVALGIVALILGRLGRLLLSRRMTVTLLSALAILCLASLAFEQEGRDGLRSAASLRNEVAVAEVFAPVFEENTCKRAGEKIMILVRTAGLTHIAGSWALYAVLLLLVLGSITGLIWRRPVGAREFGFIAAHAGLLLMLGGATVGVLFGDHRAQLRIGLDGVPRPVPGGDQGAAFSVVVREIIIEDLPPEYQVLAWRPGEVIGRLNIDGSRPGRTRWRGLDVEVEEFLPATVAEEVVEDLGVEVNNPALQADLLGGKQTRKVTLYAYYREPLVFPELGLSLRYFRTASAEDALLAARALPQGDPETLTVVSAKQGKVDEVKLGYGRGKQGSKFLLAKLGVRLEILKWYSGSRVGGPGLVTQVPPFERFPPAIQVREILDEPVDPANPDAPTAKTFWIVGGGLPTAPIGPVPTALAGLKFMYNPPRWQPVEVRVVEGPFGQYRLAELIDGNLARIRPLAMNGELKLEGGRRLRLTAFIRGARRSYRPAKPTKGQATEPAVRLSVGKGAVQESFWFFPRRSGAREILGANFAVRGVKRGLRRAAVRVEVLVEGSSVGTEVVDLGSSLQRGGYSLYFTGVNVTARRGGRLLGMVDFTASRKPGLWVLYVGMALMALGVPGLLWSRFRQVPDAVEEF